VLVLNSIEKFKYALVVFYACADILVAEFQYEPHSESEDI